MKSFRRFTALILLATAFLFTAGGCGSDNSVVEPGELTAEQEEEMEGLKDELQTAGRSTR